ncbi:MAG: patatin-like phospholipase family protein, partial [Pseudomonadales bacterium]|nr:patatin-like phospholipase family protein [Pseudomonadales bacterium]
PTESPASVHNWLPTLPNGPIQVQNLQLMLQEQFLHVSHITDFDDLRIPFRAVAGDLVTGEAVVISSGSIPTAVRASMAIPGIYAPVETDGRMLVDGGIANNLPVDVVKSMGADRVIAVDIATPLYNADELDSILPIVEQLTTLLTFNRLKKQYALITDDDLLIQPDLNDVSTVDFDKTETAIARGYQAMTDHRTELARFSHGKPPTSSSQQFVSPIITEIDIRNDSRISDKFIRAQISQELGKPFNRNQLEEDVRSIYGHEHFESVNYELETLDSGSRLIIIARAKSWGADSLGVTFNLSTDTRAESEYNLGVNFRKSAITLKGGEWFTALQIGQDPVLRSEFYLPLDYRQIFFAEPYVGYSETSYNQVSGATRDIEARFRIDNLTYGAFFGVEFSNLAIFGAGLEEKRGDITTYTGPDPGQYEFRDRVDYIQLELDTLDNLYFPADGTLTRVRYDRIDPRKNGAEKFEKLTLSATQAFPFYRNSVILSAHYARSYGLTNGRHNQASLGGFLRLSGLPDDALFGDHLLYAGMTWLRRLDEQSILPVDLPTYVGVTLEAGNVWPEHSLVSTNDLIGAGALFLGVDSPLGGFYMGDGKADGGPSSFYIKLGRL